jgi:predicted nucleic acid-binding protein
MVMADPDDDIVLACAVNGNADYVVARDAHLLALGSSRMPIVTPEVFLSILRARPLEA